MLAVMWLCSIWWRLYIDSGTPIGGHVRHGIRLSGGAISLSRTSYGSGLMAGLEFYSGCERILTTNVAWWPCLNKTTQSGVTVSGPISAFEISLPLWLPFLIVAFPTAILWRRERWIPAGHCRECGYNLTGNVSGVCPECGKKT